MFDRRVLYLLAGCLVFGTILYFELGSGDRDATLPEIAPRSDPAPAVPRRQELRTAELLDTILARPLFNSKRRPDAGAVAAAGDTDLADKRLTGILIKPGRHVAIFAIKDARPLIVGDGEQVDGWRIASISPREVALSGPGGDRTLRPQPDPNLTHPPGAPAVTGVAQPIGSVPASAAPRRATAPNIPGIPPPWPARLGPQR
jgi:general secretion pathway protein N